MKSNETKTYGSIRKIKAYGACGVILGLAALAVATAQTSYADEATTTPNTATNLQASQPAQTQAAKQTIAQANQAQGTVNVTVDNSQVNQAANQAQEAGVKVVQDTTVDKGTTNTLAETQKAQAEIAADQAKQKAAVEQTTADYQKAKADHAKAVEETKQKNAQIEAENKVLKEAHDKASQQAAKTNQAVEQAKAKIKAEFPDAKVTETTKEVKVDANKTSYDAYTKAVEQQKAENKKATETYQTEKTKEDKEIAAAKAYNETVRKQNAANKAKVDAENAEIEKRNQAKLANKKSVEAENAAITKRNVAGQAKVDAENKEIDKFNKEVAEHNQAEDARVAKEKAEAKANSAKDGYVKDIVSKYLVFGKDNVKNAKLVSVKGAEFISQKKYWEEVNKKGGNVFNVIGTNWDNLVTNDVKEATSTTSGSVLGRLAVGQTAVARYEGVNASYDGKKITAVEFHYTAKKANGKYGKINLNFEGNPTSTILAGTLAGKEGYELDVEVRYFGEDGKEILPVKGKPFLYSVASMNSYGEGTSHVEYARISSDDKFIPINGSKVARYGDLVYSKTNLEDLDALGLDKPWDREDSPYAYKGAGIVSTDKRIKFSFGVETNGQESGIVSQWFAFNTDFKSSGIPVPARYKESKPHKTFTPEKLKEVPTPKLEELKKFTPEKEKTVPTPKAKLTLVKVNGVPAPTYKPKEKEPTAPVVPTVHVHDYKLSTRPQIAKAVENADEVNVNGQYVAKNSLNRFALQTEALPANRTVYTKLVFNDHLPSGFKLDVEKTKEANKGYEVVYNEKTNFLSFTAKKEILDAVNKNRAKEYQLGALSVWGRPQNDAADYENVFEMVVNEGHSKGGYTRKSNKVLIHTPGKQQPNKPNDPKNPNRDPLKPEKHNYNAAGKLVDGKEMLPEGVNYYVSKWTNRPNKNDKSGKEAIAKGFAYIEDYQDDAVTPLESRFQVKDAQGKAVNGLKMYHVLDRKTLSKALNDMIDRSGISPKGAFYMWVAEKPEEFYKAYVQTGMDLFFHTPMKNQEGFTGKYTNQTFQVQFGNGYYSNVVVNHVPELKVQKRVYNNLGDGQNLDGKLIKLGDKFYYFLDGAKLPSDRGEALKEYRFYDDFDEKGDEFTGEYKAIAGVDIKLKDGSVIKAGADLSQYAELKYDKAKGIVEISMKQDFLDKIDNASEFDVDAAIQMKRIATGTFENTYKNVVNGHEVVSNTVKTSTLEPEKPQPKKPTPVPTVQKPSLPQTGEHSSTGLVALGLSMLAGFGFFGLKKRKENQ
ncbi:SspB-related isopeptide-forming adhesin [Streptococcus constellatus]|uniref:SspB-related isopeptide-forming adhesin n=1 Tax=Streptococcus constellatus TaxID=76860 RepID=UPI00241CB643|nr:SspB-related isopeptide-forming adhesin [Streptococcus constellatus]